MIELNVHESYIWHKEKCPQWIQEILSTVSDKPNMKQECLSFIIIFQETQSYVCNSIIDISSSKDIQQF
jgi:hypothetical protein